MNDPLTGQCTEYVPSLHRLHCPPTHTEPGRHLPGWRTTIIWAKAMVTPTSNNTVRVFIGPWETCMSVAAYQRCVHVGQILIWSHELHYLETYLCG